MLKKFFYKIFPDPDKKYLKKIQPKIKEINALEANFKRFSDKELKQRAEKLKEIFRSRSCSTEVDQQRLDFHLPEVFALVRETAKRTLGQRHFDVQLAGGIVLHEGKIAEMQTGEGKTLTATLPAFLNSLPGKGVHIVTVNDYLAQRDTVWMGQIYYFLGLSVGCITGEKAYLYDPKYQKESSSLDSKKFEERDKERDTKGSFKIVHSFLRPVPRKEAYNADITYGTNDQFGFDYLRDNLVLRKQDQVQRQLAPGKPLLYYAILDEIDSILIDEARTPLIISEPDFEASKLYKEISRFIPKLKPDVDYEMDEKAKAVYLTDQGIEHIERLLGVDNIYQDRGLKYLHYIEQGLRGYVYFKKDRDYIVKDGKVVIVDEFTGRLMPSRRYSGGLHQALEAKEGLEVKPESKVLATITFQNFFRMYERLAGMTGTAKTSQEEFEKIYGLQVITIPTNKLMQRTVLPDQIYKTENAKFRAIVRDVKERHKKGQPVLIGTNSIEKSEYLSKMLKREGIKHQVLNAKHHEREAEIIARAGRLGAVTVATNMAGRGVDIMLGGVPQDNPDWQEENQKVKELGGLHVIGAQRHEARRIDNQLLGRAGRQGDPGSSQFFISLEDDLMRIFGGEKIKRIMETMRFPEDQPIQAKVLSGAIDKAQARVEGMNFDIRHHLLEYDNVVNKHRQAVYSLRGRILNFSYEDLKKYVLSVVREELQFILERFSFQSSQSPLSQNKNHQQEDILDEIRTIIPVSSNQKLDVESLMDIAKNLLGEKEQKEGKEQTEKELRWICLKTIDMLWTEQLDIMDSLRDAVRLHALGGRDPLVEYKTQGHRIFKDLMANIRSHIARTVFKVSLTQNLRS